MFEGRKVFFKNIDIDDLLRVFHEETRSLAQEHDCGFVISRTESQRNP